MVGADSEEHTSLEDFVGHPKEWEDRCLGGILYRDVGPKVDLFSLAPRALMELIAQGVSQLRQDEQEYVFGWLAGEKVTVLAREKGELSRPDFSEVWSEHGGCQGLESLQSRVRDIEQCVDRLEFGTERMVERLKRYVDTRAQGEPGDYVPFFVRMTYQCAFPSVPELAGARGSDDSTLGFLTRVYERALFVACDRLELLTDSGEAGKAPVGGETVVFGYVRAKDETHWLPDSDSSKKGIFDLEKKEFRARGKDGKA